MFRDVDVKCGGVQPCFVKSWCGDVGYGMVMSRGGVVEQCLVACCSVTVWYCEVWFGDALYGAVE